MPYVFFSSGGPIGSRRKFLRSTEEFENEVECWMKLRGTYTCAKTQGTSVRLIIERGETHPKKEANKGWKTTDRSIRPSIPDGGWTRATTCNLHAHQHRCAFSSLNLAHPLSIHRLLCFFLTLRRRDNNPGILRNSRGRLLDHVRVSQQTALVNLSRLCEIILPKYSKLGQTE